MAITASGLFFPAFRDQWDSTALGIDLLATDMKGALLNNSATPVFATDTAWNVGGLTNTNEVSGTGWAAGGVALAGTSIADSPTGTFMFDGTDVSETTTTLTNAEAYVLYDDTNATVADAAICLVDFTTAYSTVAGTFTITWDSLGIFTIDLTP